MNINELRTKYKELMEEKDRNKTKQIELDAQIKVNQEQLDSLMDKMRDEFDIGTIEDANEVIAKLKDEIEAEMKECEEAIQKYESE